MNCWCRKSYQKCQKCQDAADRKDINLQMAYLEHNVTNLEKVVDYIVYKFTDEWGNIYDKRDL